MIFAKIKENLVNCQNLFKHYQVRRNNTVFKNPFDKGRTAFVDECITKLQEAIESFEDQNIVIHKCVQAKSLLKDSMKNNKYLGGNLERVIKNALNNLNNLIDEIAQYNTITNREFFSVKIKQDIKYSGIKKNEYIQFNNYNITEYLNLLNKSNITINFYLRDFINGIQKYNYEFKNKYQAHTDHNPQNLLINSYYSKINPLKNRIGIENHIMNSGKYTSLNERKRELFREEIEHYIKELSIQPEYLNYRPKYGALNIYNLPIGGAPQYGNCFIKLKNTIKRKCTITTHDSYIVFAHQNNKENCKVYTFEKESLTDFCSDKFKPKPQSLPNEEEKGDSENSTELTIEQRLTLALDIKYKKINFISDKESKNYVEVQIFDKIIVNNPNQIEGIYFSTSALETLNEEEAKLYEDFHTELEKNNIKIHFFLKK